MKRLFFLTLGAIMGLSAMAANDPKWQDPNFFEENRMPMRSTFIVTPTAEGAVAEHDFSQSPLYRSIGGVWKFHWTENATDAQPEDFSQIDKVVDLYESMGVDRLATWTYRGGLGTSVAAPDPIKLWDRIGENYNRVLKK